MADKPTPMTDDDLLSILRREEQASKSFQDGTLSPIRTKAQDYYDRLPYGDEQEGASQVVTSEFADAIESLMPGLMRVFTAADDLAKFEPVAPGQERWAAEASQYVPYVLMRENRGFIILSALIKDALMFRLAGVAVDIDEYKDRRTATARNISQDAVRLIVSEEAEEGADLEMELVPDETEALDEAAEQPAGTVSGTITVTRRRKRVVVESIAPEDIRWTPTARSEDQASFIGFIKRTTASDLREMGVSQDEIDDLRSDQPPTVEEAQRTDAAILGQEQRDVVGDSERPLYLVVAYVRADVNGDGISEMLRCVYAHAGGTASRLIESMEWDGPAAIALATPILMPHTIVGRCLFDQTQDLQLINSVLMRGMLDNLYIVNRPRPVISDQVNLDSLIDWVPGSPIRLKAGARPGDNHVSWLSVPDVGQSVRAQLQHLADVKEQRTGVSRYNQGLDAESLNKTLGGLNRIMSASGERQDLIARVFAETAIKRLYMLLYRAIKKAASGPVQYWTGKSDAFASCDPTQWPDDMAVSIDVVGIGNREQTIGQLAQIAQAQQQLIQLQGGHADGPFVTAENVATTANKLAETLGYKTPGMFFQPPEAVASASQQQQQNQQPPPPNPEMLKVQAQIAADQAKAQADQHMAQQKLVAETQQKQQQAAIDMQLQREKAAQELQAMREKAALELQLQREAQAANYALKRQQIESEAALERYKIDTMPKPGNTELQQQQVTS